MNKKEYNKNYRQNYGEKMMEQIKRWFLEHPDYRKQKCKEWKKHNYQHNKEYMRDYMKQYRYRKKLELSILF